MKIRWIVRVCALGLAIGLFSGQDVLANTSGTVSGTNVNIRSAASTSSQILAKKNTGDALDIVSKDGNWYKIQLSAGQIGYVFGDFVKEKAVEEVKPAAVAATTIEEKVEEKSETGYVNGTNVNFRSSASIDTTGNIIKKLNSGDQVTILGTQGDWHYVQTADGTKGYLYKTFVSVGTLTTAETSSELRQQVVQYAKQYLGLRYVYGGNSLVSGTDCSGFTQQIFKNFGIALNRPSASQSMNGVSVSINALQPGDLIFYGYGSGISHVGIYIGGSQIIHNTTSGGGVMISNMYKMGEQSVVCCRNVLQ